MRITDFIEQSDSADSEGPLIALMKQAAGDLGFDRFAYCLLTHRDPDDVERHPAIAHNFPEEWKDYYVEKNYQTKDPVVLLAPEIEGPFLWKGLSDSYNLDSSQVKLMNQAGECGLRDGVGVPLHGPRGKVCLVTFAAGDGHPDPARNLAKLDVVAAQFHSAYSKLRRPANEDEVAVALSARERECLQWIASGKSSWDIGVILNISENTVNFHIKNALHKLDANTRTLAVVKALRFGLLRL